MKRLICIAIAAVTLLGLCSCGGKKAAAGGKIIRLIMNSQPSNIDPQIASSEEELTIVRNCFEGLFRIDNGKVKKGACSSYSTSDDGLTWTFKLRGNAKWSDGEKVTANNFVYGLRRAVLPETDAENAYLLFCIENAERIRNGSADAGTLGVTAIDDSTLSIKLSTANDGLPEILSYALCMPCREDVFNDAAGRYGMESDYAVSNGPFNLTYWSKDLVRLKPNEYYGGEFTAVPSQISISFSDEDSAKIESIKSDVADIAAINPQVSSKAGKAGLKVISFNDTAWTMIINPDAKVIGDADVANAFKTSLTTDAYSSDLPVGFTAFDGIIADDLRISESSYKTLAARAPRSVTDPALAKDNFVSALKGLKSSMPAITVKYIDINGMKEIATKIAQHWQQSLGAIVNIEGMTKSDLTNVMKSGEYQIVLCPITSDDGLASSVARSFYSGSNDNIYKIESKKIDALVNQIGNGYGDNVAANVSAVENELLSNTHLIPVAESGHHFTCSSTVTGVKFDMSQGMISLYNANR